MTWQKAQVGWGGAWLASQRALPKKRKMHGPVGDYLHVNAHQSSLNWVHGDHVACDCHGVLLCPGNAAPAQAAAPEETHAQKVERHMRAGGVARLDDSEVTKYAALYCLNGEDVYGRLEGGIGPWTKVPLALETFFSCPGLEIVERLVTP